MFRFATSILLWSAALLLSTHWTLAADDSEDVRIIARAESNGFVYVAESEFDLDYTITMQLELTNATASRPLPVTVDSAGQRSFEVVRVQQKDPKLPWKASFTFNYRNGGQRNVQTNDAEYLLPYQANENHVVSQGNFGKFSHDAGSQNEYAVDFRAAPGTIICAARAGTVTGVRDDYTAGGPNLDLKNRANYVIIKHDDGTYAEYYHLQPKGALVKLGQHVASGQKIALSGNTGYTSGPHIHFAVFQTIDGKDRITLPVKFKTSQGVLKELKEGQSYFYSPPVPGPAAGGSDAPDDSTPHLILHSNATVTGGATPAPASDTDNPHLILQKK